jgi:hypothetical protein
MASENTTPTPSPYTEMEDAMTYFRMDLTITDLNLLAKLGQDTPVSGDAIRVYSQLA